MFKRELMWPVFSERVRGGSVLRDRAMYLCLWVAYHPTKMRMLGIRGAAIKIHDFFWGERKCV